MERPEMQNQIDELRVRVEELSNKIDQQMNSLQEIRRMLKQGQKQAMMQGEEVPCPEHHHHVEHLYAHERYGRRPGMFFGFFFFTMLLALIATMLVKSSSHTYYGHWMPRGIMGGRFARRES